MSPISRVSALCLSMAVLAACGDDGPSDPSPDDETGSVEVTTVSTGEDVDADGYSLQVDGAGSRAIGANAIGSLAELAAGDHQVGLTGVQANCAVEGDNPRTVTVAAGEVQTVQFEVECRDALIGQLAFYSDRDGNVEIYAMRPDGSGQVRLTNNAADDEEPAVSPDGTRILFRSARDGNLEVYLMNADGSGQVNLTNNPADDQLPSWSPDGSRIAFTSDRNGDYEIFVMNADGTGTANVSDSPASLDAHASWTPDGNRIVFVTDRDGNGEIYIMNADGSGQTNLTNDPDTDTQPVVSPDGSRMAFVTDRTGDLAEIFVMDLDGSNPENITNSPGADLIPSWSPDGTRLSFASGRTGDFEVFIMAADGSGPANISNNAATLDAPGRQTWGP